MERQNAACRSSSHRKECGLELDLLTRIVDELAGILPGSRVDKVVQSDGHRLFLVLHKRNRNLVLLLSPDRSLPRIHLVSRRPAGTGSPAGLVLSLRKQLTGSRLKHIGIVHSDRVVRMEFSRNGGECLLFFELTGSSANLLLTDAAHTILSVHRPAPPADRVRRPLLPGLVYSPPERKQHAGARSRAVRREMPQPGGEGPTPVNSAAEAWYERTIAEQEVASLRRQLVTALRRASARTERRRMAVASDIAAAERGDELRMAGELLLANLHRVAPGQERAELPGFDGNMVIIALDPSRSTAENAQRYFRRYKKAKAGLAILRERHEECRRESAFLDAAKEEVKKAPGREELLAVRSQLVRRGYVRDPQGTAAGGKMSAPPYRTVLFEGWQILVGKSAAGNDHITMKLARPEDLWLHAEGMPGSHVLVRNPGNKDVPEGVLLRAASLAAYFSKGRSSSKVPVAYTRAKFVKKPKGAVPGTVTLAERRTLMAEPLPE